MYPTMMAPGWNGAMTQNSQFQKLETIDGKQKQDSLPIISNV